MNGEKVTTADGERRLSQADTKIGTGVVSDVILPQIPDTCQAQAGPVVWAAIDAIHTVIREMLAVGLVEDGPEIEGVIRASWVAMQSASYMPEVGALEALEVEP